MIVTLLRHGKAQDYRMAPSDIERELTYDGIEHIKEVAGQLYIPGVIVASNAERVKMTVDAALLVWKKKDFSKTPEVKYFSALYMGSAETYLNALIAAGDSAMLVGHNPVIEDLLSQLCGQYIPVNPGTAIVLNLDETLKRAEIVKIVR